jgi:hypothetical protein
VAAAQAPSLMSEKSRSLGASMEMTRQWRSECDVESKTITKYYQVRSRRWTGYEDSTYFAWLCEYNRHTGITHLKFTRGKLEVKVSQPPHLTQASAMRAVQRPFTSLRTITSS